MKYKLKKCFKCNIKKCSNLVTSKGAFCKSCIDRITNDYNSVVICSSCNNIIELIANETAEKNVEKRILFTICDNCKSQFDEGNNESQLY